MNGNLILEEIETPDAGLHRVFRTKGKEKAYTQSFPECSAVDLTENDRVVDIGAYVGEYALRCARFSVRSVVAYEPTPLTFDVLKHNLRDYRNASAVQAAVVGDDRQQVTLYISSGNGTRNRLSKIRGSDGVHVPAVSYADAIAGATVVKIDVEGAEWSYPIMDHLDPPLRALIIEFHPKQKEHEDEARAIAAKIEGEGFEPVYPVDWVRFVRHGKQWGAHGAWSHPGRSTS